MAKWKFDAEKHSKPYDSFPLDKFYFIVHKNADGVQELLIFQRTVPARKVELGVGSGD